MLQKRTVYSVSAIKLPHVRNKSLCSIMIASCGCSGEKLIRHRDECATGEWEYDFPVISDYQRDSDDC